MTCRRTNPARLAHLALAVFVCSLAYGSRARASEPGLCRLAEVLDVVEAHYLRHTAHLRLIPRTAVEIRTDRDRAACAVGVEVLMRDEITGLLGPVSLQEQRNYQVRRVSTGVEVDFGGD